MSIAENLRIGEFLPFAGINIQFILSIYENIVRPLIILTH